MCSQITFTTTNGERKYDKQTGMKWLIETQKETKTDVHNTQAMYKRTVQLILLHWMCTDAWIFYFNCRKLQCIAFETVLCCTNNLYQRLSLFLDAQLIFWSQHEFTHRRQLKRPVNNNTFGRIFFKPNCIKSNTTYKN